MADQLAGGIGAMQMLEATRSGVESCLDHVTKAISLVINVSSEKTAEEAIEALKHLETVRFELEELLRD